MLCQNLRQLLFDGMNARQPLLNQVANQDRRLMKRAVAERILSRLRITIAEISSDPTSKATNSRPRA